MHYGMSDRLSWGGGGGGNVWEFKKDFKSRNHREAQKFSDFENVNNHMVASMAKKHSPRT